MVSSIGGFPRGRRAWHDPGIAGADGVPLNLPAGRMSPGTGLCTVTLVAMNRDTYPPLSQLAGHLPGSAKGLPNRLRLLLARH